MKQNESLEQNENSEPYYLKILKADFAIRKSQHANYSIRKFAKFLDVHPSSLSRLFRDRGTLTVAAALNAIRKLELSAEHHRPFMVSVLQRDIDRTALAISEGLGQAFALMPPALESENSKALLRTSS